MKILDIDKLESENILDYYITFNEINFLYKYFTLHAIYNLLLTYNTFVNLTCKHLLNINVLGYSKNNLNKAYVL